MSEAIIDTLQIKVETDAKQAASGFKSIVKWLKELQTMDLSKTDINVTTGESVKNITVLLNSLNQLWGLLKTIRKNSNLTINTKFLTSALQEIPAVDTSKGDLNEPLKVKSVAGTNKPEPIAPDVKKYAELLDKIKTTSQSLFKKSNEFLSSIKRIAMYRIIRSLVKVVEDGLREGTKNLYNFSKQTDTTFAKSLDQFTTSMAYLKNSVITMIEPLVNAVVPFIDTLVDNIVSAFNEVSKAFNAALGNQTWTRAIKNAKQYNAEIKKTVLGFDQLNKMNGNENNSAFDFVTEKLTNRDLEEAENTLSNIRKILYAIIGISIGSKLPDILSLFKSKDSVLPVGKISLGIAIALPNLLSLIENAVKTAREGLTTSTTLESEFNAIGLILGGFLIGGVKGALIGAMAGFGILALQTFIDSINNEQDWFTATLSTSFLAVFGAALGTIIAPGIGTLIGLLAGVVVGAIANLVLLITKTWETDIKPFFEYDVVNFFIGIVNFLAEVFENFINNSILGRINILIKGINAIGNLFPNYEPIKELEIQIGRLETKVKPAPDFVTAQSGKIQGSGRGGGGRGSYDGIFDPNYWQRELLPSLFKNSTTEQSNIGIVSNDIAQSAFEAVTAKLDDISTNEKNDRDVEINKIISAIETNLGDITINLYDESGSMTSQQVIDVMNRSNRRAGNKVFNVNI